MPGALLSVSVAVGEDVVEGQVGSTGRWDLVAGGEGARRVVRDLLRETSLRHTPPALCIL